jgi:hypothetical protein
MFYRVPQLKTEKVAHTPPSATSFTGISLSKKSSSERTIDVGPGRSVCFRRNAAVSAATSGLWLETLVATAAAKASVPALAGAAFSFSSPPKHSFEQAFGHVSSSRLSAMFLDPVALGNQGGAVRRNVGFRAGVSRACTCALGCERNDRC